MSSPELDKLDSKHETPGNVYSSLGDELIERGILEPPYHAPSAVDIERVLTDYANRFSNVHVLYVASDAYTSSLRKKLNELKEANTKQTLLGVVESEANHYLYYEICIQPKNHKIHLRVIDSAREVKCEGVIYSTRVFDKLKKEVEDFAIEAHYEANNHPIQFNDHSSVDKAQQLKNSAYYAVRHVVLNCQKLAPEKFKEVTPLSNAACQEGDVKLNAFKVAMLQASVAKSTHAPEHCEIYIDRKGRIKMSKEGKKPQPASVVQATPIPSISLSEEVAASLPVSEKMNYVKEANELMDSVMGKITESKAYAEEFRKLSKLAISSGQRIQSEVKLDNSVNGYLREYYNARLALFASPDSLQQEQQKRERMIAEAKTEREKQAAADEQYATILQDEELCSFKPG